MNYKSHFIFIIIHLFLMTSFLDAGLKIYYIRHIECGHNVKKDWEERGIPKDEWPDYVGNHLMRTPKGDLQQAAVSSRLQKLESHFDFIASSPAWRARQTILPYMKELNLKGEIWPELSEHSSSSRLLFDPKLPKIRDRVLGEGQAIMIPEEERNYFSLRSDGLNEFKVPREARKDDRLKTATGKLVMQAAIDLLLERFSGKDKTILLAGHKASGMTLIRMLTKKVDYESIENAGIWMLEQQEDGSFEVMLYNSVPPKLVTEVRFDHFRADLSEANINGHESRESEVMIKKYVQAGDLVYSFYISDQNFDGVGGSNDSLSWDIRVKGFENGKIIKDEKHSYVELGDRTLPFMTEAYFGISDKRYLKEGDSIQFSIENINLNAQGGARAKFNGFDGIYGTNDTYVFGEGISHQKSKTTDSDDDMSFAPVTCLTLSCPHDKFRIRDLTGSFSIIRKDKSNL